MKTPEVLRAEENVVQKILQWLFDEHFINSVGAAGIIAKAVGMVVHQHGAKLVVGRMAAVGCKRGERVSATVLLRAEEQVARKILQFLFSARVVTAGGEAIIAKAVGMEAKLDSDLKVVVSRRRSKKP